MFCRRISGKRFSTSITRSRLQMLSTRNCRNANRPKNVSLPSRLTESNSAVNASSNRGSPKSCSPVRRPAASSNCSLFRNTGLLKTGFARRARLFSHRIGTGAYGPLNVNCLFGFKSLLLLLFTRGAMRQRLFLIRFRQLPGLAPRSELPCVRRIPGRTSRPPQRKA